MASEAHKCCASHCIQDCICVARLCFDWTLPAFDSFTPAGLHCRLQAIDYLCSASKPLMALQKHMLGVVSRCLIGTRPSLLYALDCPSRLLLVLLPLFGPCLGACVLPAVVSPCSGTACIPHCLCGSAASFAPGRRACMPFLDLLLHVSTCTVASLLGNAQEHAYCLQPCCLHSALPERYCCPAAPHC